MTKKKTALELRSDSRQLIKLLRDGRVGIIPTDTIYGLVAVAKDRAAVERIYNLKGRQAKKPFIILIADIKQLNDFGIDRQDSRRAAGYWPAAVSLILPTLHSELAYLHRGGNSLAFRLPDHEQLRQLITQTGPLVAPSANPQGETPATTRLEARQYFGDRVDFFVDGGKLAGKPSKLISLLGSRPKVLRD